MKHQLSQIQRTYAVYTIAALHSGLGQCIAGIASSLVDNGCIGAVYMSRKSRNI